MKKYAILLLAGSVIALASCGDESNITTQTQIDSAVNARCGAMEAELRAQNDSLINAMAMMKADSAMRADSIAAARMGRPYVRPATKTTKPKSDNTTTKDGRLNTDKNTSKDNDGRLNTDKSTNPKDKSKDNDGRLKTD